MRLGRHATVLILERSVVRRSKQNHALRDKSTPSLQPIATQLLTGLTLFLSCHGKTCRLVVPLLTGKVDIKGNHECHAHAVDNHGVQRGIIQT